MLAWPNRCRTNDGPALPARVRHLSLASTSRTAAARLVRRPFPDDPPSHAIRYCFCQCLRHRLRRSGIWRLAPRSARWECLRSETSSRIRPASRRRDPNRSLHPAERSDAKAPESRNPSDDPLSELAVTREHKADIVPDRAQFAARCRARDRGPSGRRSASTSRRLWLRQVCRGPVASVSPPLEEDFRTVPGKNPLRTTRMVPLGNSSQRSYSQAFLWLLL